MKAAPTAGPLLFFGTAVTSTAGIAVDRRFGLIQERSTSSLTTLVLVRHIPGPGGVVATSAGESGAWVYRFGEERGNRFTTTDQVGFVQDVSHDAFGVASKPGIATSNPSFMRDQWNGGTALEAFGVVQLGARPYDPRLGRFLSRDPLMIPRSATKTNPYAFAANDPVNLSDPSGLDFGICSTSTGAPCGGSSSNNDTANAVGTALGIAGLIYGFVSDDSSDSATPAAVPRQDTSAVGTPIAAAMWPTFKPSGALNYAKGVATGFGGAAKNAWDGAQRFQRDLITGRLGIRALEAAGGLVDAAMHPRRTAAAMRDGVVAGISAIVGGDPKAMGELLFDLASVAAGGVAARAAPLAVARALPAARQIEAAWGASVYRHGGLTNGLEHIMYRHSAGSVFPNISRFAPGTRARTIVGYVDDALRNGTATPNGVGAYVVEHNFGRVIGTNRAGNAATSIRVFVRGGIIQTAFPY